MNKDLSKFSLSIYGNVTAYNNVCSKARCRIFYKYGNRNGTYITDEFAEKLVSSLPYTPIKGIYDSMQNDYTDHGKQRYEGRIYGVVPVENNFAWELHVDEDGVEREYACTDILLFTAIYQKEALEIVGNSQSMELYTDSIDGTWKFIDGKKYFVFTEGCFLGLQVLGQQVEPCFEGAAFYSLYDSIQNVVSQIEAYERAQNTLGGESMNFKLSDNQKYNMIWSLVNPRFNEENGYIMDCAVCDVYDEYAIIYNFNEQNYERAYYTKDDSNDSLEITNREIAYIIDVNANEKQALETLRTLNGDTYEKVDENYNIVKEQNEQLTINNNGLTTEKETFSQKIEEQATQIATLEQEKADIQTELNTMQENYSNATTQIETLTQENNDLATFKADVMLQRKQSIIDRYNNQLTAETLQSFEDKINDLSIAELEKELAYALVQSKPTLFTLDLSDPQYVPKDNDISGGIERILSRYKK